VTLAARLRVIERSEAITDLLNLLKYLLVRLMRRISGEAIALVVKAGRGFGINRGCGGKDKSGNDETKDGCRDHESHVHPPFLASINTTFPVMRPSQNATQSFREREMCADSENSWCMP